jgi:hypothetical protein
MAEGASDFRSLDGVRPGRHRRDTVRCDRCEQEDVPDRQAFVGLDPRHMPVFHHECPAGHAWHCAAQAGPEAQREECDCWDA